MENFTLSQPKRFRHERSVGLTREGGFHMHNIPKEWCSVFERAGVTEKDLRDARKSKYIMGVIARHSVKPDGGERGMMEERRMMKMDGGGDMKKMMSEMNTMDIVEMQLRVADEEKMMMRKHRAGSSYFVLFGFLFLFFYCFVVCFFFRGRGKDDGKWGYENDGKWGEGEKEDKIEKEGHAA